MSALEHAMNAHACNQAQALALHNPDTPEIDSLVELVLASPLEPVWKRRLLLAAQRVQDWNDTEGAMERKAIGLLDEQSPRGLRAGYGVKDAAARLRPVLARGNRHAARLVVRSLLRNPECGERVLCMRSLRGQLGADQYAELVCILREFGIEATP